MNSNFNLLKNTDSYKCTMYRSYCPKLEILYSYLESRGGRFNETMFFGLQYYLNMIKGVQVTKEKIDDAQIFWEAHFGRKDIFNREGWEYILNVHNGKLPLKIKSVKEGSIIPTGNILMSIENTDPKCFWLTTWVETLLLKIFYTITIATQSHNIKKDITKFLEKSGTTSEIEWKCHDFSFRGNFSEESAALGAASHLLSFMGTDTVSGITLLQEHYGAGMCGHSIPATEHSNMSSFGKANEITACRNFLNQYPTGLIACVSDTWDIYNCVENIWCGALKKEVCSRNGTLVIRPDSGDYFDVLPKIMKMASERIGSVDNSKGYTTLDKHVRFIWGDSMRPDTINALYEHIIKKGWSADNLAVGSGGGLMVEGITRDTNKFAIKASAARIDGKWTDIFKDPITDTGKKSKKGRLKLIKSNGIYQTVSESHSPDIKDELELKFENGELFNTTNLDQIKKNII